MKRGRFRTFCDAVRSMNGCIRYTSPPRPVADYAPKVETGNVARQVVSFRIALHRTNSLRMSGQELRAVSDAIGGDIRRASTLDDIVPEDRGQQPLLGAVEKMQKKITGLMPALGVGARLLVHALLVGSAILLVMVVD
jgi:hypothetical protein